MDTWFETLFKFSRLNYAEGELGFQTGPLTIVYAAVLLGLVVLTVWLYLRSDRYAKSRHRVVALALRLAALALLALPLFEPQLIVADVVPEENFVAVVVDDSKSMTIPDGPDGATRVGQALAVLAGAEAPVVPGLEEHFKVRYYTFSDVARRVDSLGGAGAGGASTDLEAALTRISDDFTGVPLAGIVLLTDGADQSRNGPLGAAEELRQRDVPIHVVGLGREAFEREREVIDATVNEGIEETTGAEIDVKVRSWGAEPQPVGLSLMRGEDVVYTTRKQLKGQGQVDQFTLFFEPPTPEAQAYTLRLETAEGELNIENNALDLLVDTRKDTIRVLYFEGQLRWDTKLMKRTLEDDHGVEIVSVARTGPGKLYRQGVRSGSEVAGGFPASREEFFDYHVVLFGDLEASFFTLDQLELVEEFVRLRGGGFAMMGGRNAFAEGAYWNTPVADLLPVELDPSRRTVLPPQFGDPEAPPEERGFAFAPTTPGYESPILRLAAEPRENRARWSGMPGLTSINYLGSVKPGAVVLAEKPEDDYGDREPVLIAQRYGKGRTAALATASTWRWQMLLEAEDPRYERFWRQLIRWLAASAPGTVALDLGQSRFTPDEPVPVRVQVLDRSYFGVQNADIELTVTDAGGRSTSLPVTPVLTEPGAYESRFDATGEGMYVVRARAYDQGALIGEDEQWFLVGASRVEFTQATQRRTLLESLAATTDGSYYTPATASAIPDNLRGRRTSRSVYHADPLWDMPTIFGLVLLLLAGEWLFRRRRGLP